MRVPTTHSEEWLAMTESVCDSMNYSQAAMKRADGVERKTAYVESSAKASNTGEA